MTETNKKEHPMRRTCDDPNSAEHCHMAEGAADQAVKKVFAILGVDIDNPEQVERFREDLRFGRTLRQVANKFLMGVTGAAALGVAIAIWYGIMSKMGMK